jgi:hypothetical protein
MSNVIPFPTSPLQKYREVIKLPRTEYVCERCPGLTIMSKERQGDQWVDVLPMGWKRVSVFKGKRFVRSGVICRWCVSTAGDVVVEVIGGKS